MAIRNTVAASTTALAIHGFILSALRDELTIRGVWSRPRGQVRSDVHDVLWRQLLDDHLHQRDVGVRADARTLLNVEDLPCEIAWRSTGNRRHVRRDTHQVQA